MTPSSSAPGIGGSEAMAVGDLGWPSLLEPDAPPKAAAADSFGKSPPPARAAAAAAAAAGPYIEGNEKELALRPGIGGRGYPGDKPLLLLLLLPLLLLLLLALPLEVSRELTLKSEDDFEVGCCCGGGVTAVGSSTDPAFLSLSFSSSAGAGEVEVVIAAASSFGDVTGLSSEAVVVESGAFCEAVLSLLLCLFPPPLFSS